jgi:hypothetical protein
MIKKPFCPELYGKYDNVAKVTLVEHLLDEGHELLNQKENYNADVVTEKEGITYYSEAEVKSAWTDDWPTTWAEIRIPERKKRLLTKHTENLKFYIFRKDLKQCWCIDSSQLIEDNLKEARGRNIYKGEKFFHVPYNEAQLINLAQ